MKSLTVALLLASLSVCAAEFTVNGRRFTLREGFTIELAAGPDLAPRPVSGAFDEQGRLYLTDSSGSSEAPSKQAEHPSHRVLRLADRDGDGRYDEAVVFADKLMFPEGCLWLDGSVYVGAPPVIWKLTDTNQDGIADVRDKWWDGGTLTGCANDLHGPFLGPDGFIYWTKGAFAEQNHARKGRPPVHDKAAHILRARPDGSDFEAVMTGGMDNPVEVAFTPEGEPLFTSTFIDFTQPGRRDGIAYAVYGGVYGKPNQVVEDRRVTRTSSEFLPVMTQFGAGAPSGLCRKESAAWGEEYRDNFFASSFNLHKITRHRVTFHGAAYESADDDFLVCSEVDFHPTDVLEDPDGSLLVVDTGGWYRICCPSSQLAKPDVLGAVYRIRKTGASGPRLKPGAPPNHRDGSYWAAKQAGMKRDVQAAAALRTSLAALCDQHDVSQLALARVTCEALGRIGDTAAAPGILAAAALADDAFLQHSVVFALIELNASQAARAGLDSPIPAVRRAALIALAEMPGGDLKPVETAEIMAGPAGPAAAAAQWILGRRPEWGGELAGWFRERWLSPTLIDGQRFVLNAVAPVLADSDAGRALLAEVITNRAFGNPTRRSAFLAVAGASFKKPPEVWVTAVAAAAASGVAGSLPLGPVAVQAAAALAEDPRAAAALHAIAIGPKGSKQVRADALAGLPAGSPLDEAEFTLLRERLSPPTPGAGRSSAAAALAKAALTRRQQEALLENVQQADPVTLDRLLGAFDKNVDAALAERLVAALKASPAGRSLSPAQLRAHVSQYAEDARKLMDAFAASLNASAAAQGAQLAALLDELKKLPADPRRGQELFNGPKAACSACHKIGYVGGAIGPELTSIGEARSEQDLLESIAYPSATFARGYEPSAVRLKDGETINGIIRNETGETLEIVTGPGPTTTVRRADVVETTPGAVSIMPAGFAEVLSKQELADLLHFVKTVRWR